MGTFKRTVLLGVVAPLAIGLVSATAITARQETPLAAECLVAPRAIDEIDAIVADEPAVAASPTSGDISAAERDSAVTATIREAIACANANDPLRSLALFTDRYIAERFGPAHPDDLGSLRAAVSRSPVPADESDLLTLVEIGPIETLSDGRVQTVVITENQGERFTDQLVLLPAGDRWLIDDWSPAADLATPTA